MTGSTRWSKKKRDSLARTFSARALGALDAVLVDLGAQGDRAVRLVLHEQPPVELVQRLVHLVHLALFGAHDHAGLATVQDQVAVLALQAQADPAW